MYKRHQSNLASVMCKTAAILKKWVTQQNAYGGFRERELLVVMLSKQFKIQFALQACGIAGTWRW